MIRGSTQLNSTGLVRPLRRQVVVTGIGAVTPLGLTFTDTWRHLLTLGGHGGVASEVSAFANGNSGPFTTFDEALKAQDLPDELLERELNEIRGLPCQVAAPVRRRNDEDLDYWQYKYNSRTSRCAQFALHAAAEALCQAQLFNDENDWFGLRMEGDGTADPLHERRRRRAGVCVGSGMASVRDVVQAARLIDTAVTSRAGKSMPHKKLSPYFVPTVLLNTAAGRIAMQYQMQGPNLAPSTACAAGCHAIGEAFRWIQYGQTDLVIAGATEACIDPVPLAGFCRLQALSTNFNATPELSSRPFDVDRDGFVMGEGCAVLLLEELEHALERNAPILAEVVGYGCTSDAFHSTAPHPEGRGAQRAMEEALSDATDLLTGINGPERPVIAYVNAHATSTPKGDEIEAAAVQKALERNQSTPAWISSTKGATGHLLGAAGALESAFCIQSLKDHIVPPTQNLDTISDASQGNMLQHVAKRIIAVDRSDSMEYKFAMNNSFGFGGTNACLIFQASS